MQRCTRMALTLLAALVATVPGVHAQEEFDAAQLFIELNDTDNDAGVLVFLDGPEWRWLRIRDPFGQKIAQITSLAELRALGLTELFFESGEPTPEEVLGLFPEGEYTFRARLLEGGFATGTATLSHEFLPAPGCSPCNGETTDPNNTVVTWTDVGAVSYEAIVENEDLGVIFSAILLPPVTEVLVPPTFLQPGTEYEAEVLAIGANGNKTISEGSFVTMP